MRVLTPLTATFGVVLIVTAGCAGSDRGGGRDAPPVSQAWALVDGVVTEQEYRTAVDQFVGCVREAGYTVGDPVLSPIDSLSLLSEITPSGDVATYNDAVQRCNASTVSHIEPRYVEPRHQRMDDKLRSVVGRCLRDRGVAVTGQEDNIEDFAANTSDDVLLGCVLPAAREAFPELPGMITIRK